MAVIVKKGLGVERLEEALHILNESWHGKVGLNGSFILGLPHDGTSVADELLAWTEKPIVRSTIIDCFASPLKLVKSELAQMGYSSSENGWVNQCGYSEQLATQQSTDFHRRFYSRYDLPVAFPNFSASALIAAGGPFNLSDDIKSVYLSRQTSKSIPDVRSMIGLTQRINVQRYEKYLNHLLA